MMDRITAILSLVVIVVFLIIFSPVLLLVHIYTGRYPAKYKDSEENINKAWDQQLK